MASFFCSSEEFWSRPRRKRSHQKVECACATMRTDLQFLRASCRPRTSVSRLEKTCCGCDRVLVGLAVACGVGRRRLRYPDADSSLMAQMALGVSDNVVVSWRTGLGTNCDCAFVLVRWKRLEEVVVFWRATLRDGSLFSAVRASHLRR